jgi:mono/diheme cytochrome c family protein/glucose/arabinose dehydrogenase
MSPRCWWSLLGFAGAVSAQQGDRPGEAQTSLPATLVVPPAPARSPAEQATTMQLREGFELQLFAAEPLVADPVAAALDAAGRMWVVEMRGYMNDIDATGERAANGRIVVLADDDGDGRADRSTVFADELVLPRAVLPLRGGALVVAPPDLVWLPDADGDLRADGRQALAGGFEAGLDNPEHSGNGLLWGLDQRIHVANDARLWRWTPAGFRGEAGAGGGQWGISHDDRGRCYFNYNEDWLRCDLVPGRYGPLAAATGGMPSLNWRVCPERTVWPIRITPGVNRGYQAGRLVEWVLAIHTAVCAPHVYRGGLLPCDGDVFVCEPAGNVVRRIVLQERDALMRGDNPYEAERREFLASSDERFRPVGLLTGADGALYVVDMYRGVIQHRNFVTTFLRRQIEARGLERPIGLGRIWRIAPTGTAARSSPSLHDVPALDLVAALGDRNGARRDLAMRELVLRQERTAAAVLRASARSGVAPATRIAAFGVLVGLELLTADDVRSALRDDDVAVQAFALPYAGPFLAAGDGHLWARLAALAANGPANVRWLVALALADVGAAPTAARYRDRRLALLGALLAEHGDDAALRAALAVAAGDDLVALLVQWRDRGPAAPKWCFVAVRDLAARALRTRREALQSAVFDAAAAGPADWTRALLRGAVDGLPKGVARDGWLVFGSPPRSLVQLAGGGDRDVVRLAQELAAAVVVAGAAASSTVHELTAAQQQLVRAGERVYARACAACHQLDGRGMPGLAPPLRDSEWALGPAERLVRIVAHGVRGPIEVAGTMWTLEMPAQAQLSDAELAQVTSYVRRAFGHAATTIDAADVAALRAAHRDRAEPWTAQELLGTK